tara:strand:- start:478 stop:582 length:105 start_codon:yes stop_codon:yes gene_type:complete
MRLTDKEPMNETENEPTIALKLSINKRKKGANKK